VGKSRAALAPATIAATLCARCLQLLLKPHALACFTVSFYCRTILLIMFSQLLANATAAFEQGNLSSALHIYTVAQQQSTQEADAALRVPATATAKSVQFASTYAPGVDLKMAQVGLGMSLHGCASCHRATNQLSAAQECYTESLRVLTKSLGSHHPELASVWNNLGSLQSQLNRMPAALECYEHAVDVLQAQGSRLSNLHLSKVNARHRVDINVILCACRCSVIWLHCTKSRGASRLRRGCIAKQPSSARTTCA
jgi:tetratricopeptide (TPR) repeat protein